MSRTTIDYGDAWVELRHGGNLLDRKALDALPPAGDIPRGLALRIRKALAALPHDRAPKGADLSPLLDVVLEEACGLVVGWRKGPAVGAADAERLLDGTVLKPARVWTGPNDETLVVFTSTVKRVGIGKGKRPAAHVTEYLRRRRLPLGLLTNGREWRLVWADTDSLAWAEWDSDRLLAADLPSDALLVLRRVLGRQALTRQDGAELSPLLDTIRATRRGQGKLSKELGERVRRAVETLLRARRPVLDPVWDEHSPSDLYVAACHFVMRLVVVLFAEARELLPVDNPVYHQAYGLRGLLDALDRLGPDRRRGRASAWPRLLALFRLLHGGSPHPALNIPAYGGDLFRVGASNGDAVQRALAVLEAAVEPPDDDTVHRMLALLTRTTQRVRDGASYRNVAAPVDFTELTSEYIGILYEGVLDYELHRAGADPVLFLNLGDQPALPLDRLEGMDDKALAALVEKAKVKKAAKKEGEEGAGEEDVDESEDDDEADEDVEADADEDIASGDEETAVADDETPDDARAAARARAVAWAERAALAGALVRKPRGKKGAQDPAWQAQLRKAAEALVADIKLPGELYLVRWGGTRKGAGTFYTRPQLTLPTVRRTLEPLLHDEQGRLKAPEELIALKVCDPAMGSGSFLVAALRVLTEAVVRALREHDRVIDENEHIRVAWDLLPEERRHTTPEQLDANVRRLVVEHCLYGVDLDPLAVELGRVALWVETLDQTLPFTFLDHKLRCGDSLVGCWLDRFRHYPLLAWHRKSPDEKWKGVHHPADTWARKLTDRTKVVAEEQALILLGQTAFEFAHVTDEELTAALDGLRKTFDRIHDVPIDRPDERARIWREELDRSPGITRVREAMDTWCALWFWPNDRLELAPGVRRLPRPTEESREVVRALRDRLRFFHWELEFPDVFTDVRSGFDAVVGNPPWETWQVQSMEFFSNIDPLYRSYGNLEAGRYQMRLFSNDSSIEEEWLRYNAGYRDRVNFVRNAGHPFGDAKVAGHDGATVHLAKGKAGTDLHRAWQTRRNLCRSHSDRRHPFLIQGGGKPYAYRMFLESGLSILKRETGMMGMIVPSGMYSDFGSRDIRRRLLEEGSWEWVYGFENRNKVFDIDSRFKFCVVIARKGGRTRRVRASFMRHAIEDWSTAAGVAEIQLGSIKKYSPKILSLLEVRTPRDQEILDKLYHLGHNLGSPNDVGWQVRYRREFNSTDDSALFPPVTEWESRGYSATPYGAFRDASNDVVLPLLEGRLVEQFDPMAAAWISGKGRGAVWRSLDWSEKAMRPQFCMSKHSYMGHEKRFGQPKIAIMEVASATNRRTCFAALAPDWPGIHKTPFLSAGGDRYPQTLALACIMNSFVFDSVARLKVSGLSLGWFILETLPLPGDVEVSTRRVAPIALSLNCAHASFSEVWLRMRSAGLGAIGRCPWKRLWAVTPRERVRYRSIADAIVADLYGLSRDDFFWILHDCAHPVDRLRNRAFCRTLDPKGFWRVDKDKDPELRHTVLSLVAFDALQEHIAAAGGDRDKGIASFCDQNDGDGWMLPETLRLADHGLGHDERAKVPQPVASRLGPRFLDWQLAQTPEESWAECERHARAILGDEEFERRFGDGAAAGGAPDSDKPRASGGGQGELFPGPQMKLFD